MDWLCLQSLTYLCLGRGGNELESNISTLYGVASSWILITSHFKEIASDGTGISLHGGMGIGCYLGRLPLCCSICGVLPMTTPAWGYDSLKFGHFPNRRVKGNERVGGPKPDNGALFQRLFLELGARVWQGEFTCSKSLSEEFQILCLARGVTVQSGRNKLATLKLKDCVCAVFLSFTDLFPGIKIVCSQTVLLSHPFIQPLSRYITIKNKCL